MNGTHCLERLRDVARIVQRARVELGDRDEERLLRCVARGE
jgi:hypothetical protein